METTEQKVEIALPADLAKRFTEAKTPAERNAVLAEFAKSRGAEDQARKEATAMSDEQFNLLMTRMGEAAGSKVKDAIEKMAAVTEERFAIPRSDAREIAERS